MNTSYGITIKAERERRNLTQSQLATKSSVSLPTISRIEQGLSSSPSSRAKLEEALKSIPVSIFYQNETQDNELQPTGTERN